MDKCKHPRETIDRIPGVTGAGTRYVVFRCRLCGKEFGALFKSPPVKRQGVDPDFDQREIDRAQGTVPYPGEDFAVDRRPYHRR